MRAPAPCARLEPKRGTCRPRTEHAAARRPKSRMTTRRELANAIRALSMDAVQRANSGHPGMPMGMADIAQVLWADFLRHNPANPRWADRDRFVLSNGHGSMLLYSLLYLTGYPLTIEDLQHFRQLGSKTPGHPEYDPHCGIETTTGPLGQGLANAVGMALAERLLGVQFNRPGFNLVDHYTYAFCGDGCLMEGVSHEACSLAGTLALGKLIVFYDDNGISIDGEVSGWFTDNTPERFSGYGWHVVPNVDGLDAGAVSRAIQAARAARDRPSLICCKTIIGYGAPHKQGTKVAHGEALGAEEVAATRQSSQAVLNILAPALPEVLGGSADLTGSNNTLFKGARTITPAQGAGDYLHYGVREFGMTAIMNGISLHGGFIVYGGTFLVFSDYARNAVRLGCLMSLRVILVYTHDSIGLGEDGPTHQPIEHLSSLRAMPHMSLWRPCDAAETAVAWTLAIERQGPTALALTRQPLPQQPRTPAQLADIRRGGHVLLDCSGAPECP